MDQQVLRILVVINQEDLRNSITSALGDRLPAHVVETAEDAAAAWAKVAHGQAPYEVLLIGEPLSDEEEPANEALMSHIKSFYQQAETVSLAGSDGESAQTALQVVVSGRLKTPVVLDELRRAVGRAVEQQQLRTATREKRLLEQLMQTSATLFSRHSQQEVFASILAGIRDIGFDRIRLYMPSSGPWSLFGTAHLGMDDQFIGTEWPIVSDSYLALLMKDPQPRVFGGEQGGVAPGAEPVATGGQPCVYIPLALHDEFIGLLAADNAASQRPIAHLRLVPVGLFASQAAAAIKNARIFEQAQKRAQALDTALRVSTTINSSLHSDEILNATCKAAVELFNVSHSGLVLFGPDFQEARVVAEYPAFGIVGHDIRLAEVPAEHDLLTTGQPLAITDLDHDTRLAEVGEMMCWYGIRSTLIVPVVSKGKMIGSFGLDIVDSTRVFAEEEIELCKLFAAQVAVAIENAQLFERLLALRRTSLAITSEKKPDAILLAIINQAVELLKAYSGGIYRYNDRWAELTIIADNRRPTKVGKTLPLGMGMAGKLVQTGKRYLKVPSYEESHYRVNIFDEEGPFGAVLQVPLKWKDEIIGVLYIEDPKRREFTDEDAELLRLFADQAAIAVENAELIASDEERLAKLEMLSRATREIMVFLGENSLYDTLTLIARHAAQILDAEACGVHLVKHPGVLALEASYGHAEGGFQRGREFLITSGPKTGLTGHIAHEGKLFNSCGEELISHPAITGIYTGHAPSQYMYSLLTIPLKKKEGEQEELIGLLRADNKKGKDGRAHPKTCFTKEDEWIIEIFAKTVVIAIDNARQRHHLDRLITSSPNGLIAVDAQGRITQFNHRAEEVLKYTAGEVLYKRITPLYSAPIEARRITLALENSPDGQLKNYLTSMKSKDGDIIPIRVSAAWLYANDSPKKRIGGVGYFEDLRSIEAEERKRELLLKASNVVAHTENLTEGLNSLASMIVKFLKHTFCRILLLDQSGHYFVVRAAQPIRRRGKGLSWSPQMDHLIALSAWPGLRAMLERERHKQLCRSDERERVILENLSKELGLSDVLQSMMVIPLKRNNRLVGLLEVGEVRSEQRTPFTSESIKLATSIADQATLLIDRLRFYEFSERLQQAARKMSEVFTISDLLQTVVDETKSILRGDSSSVWLYNHGLNRFLPGGLVTAGIPDEFREAFSRLNAAPGGITHTVLERDWLAVSNLNDSTEPFLVGDRRELLLKMGIQSFQGHTLKVGQEVLAVLYVNYNQRLPLSHHDRRLMKDLTDRAALALKRVQVLDQINKARMMARAVVAATARGGLKSTLHQIAEGTMRAVEGHAVTLYVYNPLIGRFDHPSTMVDVYHEEKVTQSQAKPDSIVYKMLNRDEPYIVDNVADNEDFRASRFTLEEGIKSLIAVPLKLADQPVGVMFVNYRTPHRFTIDQVANIRLLADQAAMAILFEVLNQRLREQAGLQAFSEKLLRALTRQETLDGATATATALLGADCASVVLTNKRGELVVEAALGWPGVEAGKTLVPAGRGSQTGFTIEQRKAIVVEDYAQETRFVVPQLISDHGVKSGLSVPIYSEDNFIGAMLVHSRTHRYFTGAEEKLLSLIANQTMIALKNIEQIESIKMKVVTLTTLYNAAKAITASFGSSQEEVLNEITQQAVECVIGHKPEKRGFGTIQLYDKDARELVFRSFHQLNMDMGLKFQLGRGRFLGAGKVGITGRTAIEGAPQMVPDVRLDADHCEFYSETRSELDVPLLERDGKDDKVIGVLGLESEEVGAFDDDDLITLLALAELATIAIQSGRRYDELKETTRQLKETRDMVAAQTTITWMGMASSVWGHSISGNIINIRDQVTLINERLKGSFLFSKTRAWLTKKLETIECLAEEVLDVPLLQPLASGKGVSNFRISELLKERAAQLWRSEPYRSVALKWELTAESDVVRCSWEWTRRAFDIVIDNAVNVLKKQPKPELIISTSLAEGGVRIDVTDTGPGIPPAVLAQLFKGQIKKSPDGKGLGLMIAKTIIQAYGGNLEVAATGPQGTTMRVWLPLAEPSG
jgi:PAS domain S-box-containing protein